MSTFTRRKDSSKTNYLCSLIISCRVAEAKKYFTKIFKEKGEATSCIYYILPYNITGGAIAQLKSHRKSLPESEVYLRFTKMCKPINSNFTTMLNLRYLHSVVSADVDAKVLRCKIFAYLFIHKQVVIFQIV